MNNSAMRRKFKPAFGSELSDLTVGAYLDLMAQHGQLGPSTTKFGQVLERPGDQIVHYWLGWAAATNSSACPRS